jgi:hypothetical protein
VPVRRASSQRGVRAHISFALGSASTIPANVGLADVERGWRRGHGAGRSWRCGPVVEVGSDVDVDAEQFERRRCVRN